MDEEQIEAVHEGEEITADPSTGAGIDAGDSRPRAGFSRWMRQFVIGAVIAGTLVFALGRRAELSSVVTLAQARRQMQNGHSFQAARALEGANQQNPGDRAVR